MTLLTTFLDRTQVPTGKGKDVGATATADEIMQNGLMTMWDLWA